MTEDARFEDGDERPLRLLAATADDLEVISSLVQDAVFPSVEMTWKTSERRFGMLLNRFRWEDLPKAVGGKRPVERVQSVLAFDDVTGVSSQGVQRDGDVILSLLSLSWEPSEDGAGRVIVTLAGDGAIALNVECVNVTLQDVTRPYIAPSGQTPQHPDI